MANKRGLIFVKPRCAFFALEKDKRTVFGRAFYRVVKECKPYVHLVQAALLRLTFDQRLQMSR